MKGKQLFKTNANHLSKVLAKLDYSQDMNSGMKILGETNQKLLIQAADKVREAIMLLRQIS